MLTRRRLLRDGAVIASGSLCTPWASAYEQANGGGAEQSWTIGNELVRRVVAFGGRSGVAGGIGLFTMQLSDVSIDGNYILRGKTRAGAAEEFSFRCNDRECTGAGGAFGLVGSSESAIRKGKSLAVRLRHKELPLEVTVVYEVFDGHAAMR